MRNGANWGSLRMFFHFPGPCFSTPAISASSSSCVHFCFWFPIQILSFFYFLLSSCLVLAFRFQRHRSTFSKAVEGTRLSKAPPLGIYIYIGEVWAREIFSHFIYGWAKCTPYMARDIPFIPFTLSWLCIRYIFSLSLYLFRILILRFQRFFCVFFF